MIENDGFYTLKGYQLNETDTLTSSMEDYLEMICRMYQSISVVRIHDLAKQLHVKASSASKMVGALKQHGYVEFEKYGYILPTREGLQVGTYLLYRHDTLHRFLCLLNHSQNELEQVEKLEHFMNKTTVENIEKLTKLLSASPWADVPEECPCSGIYSKADPSECKKQ